MLKTQTVAGHTLTLHEGVRYRASRAMASRGWTKFNVTVEPIDAPADVLHVMVHGLSYEAATKLVNAFNNGETSFEGSVW